MLKLYCFPRSGNSREVRLVCAEKGIPYEMVNVHAESFDNADPEFRKASPAGKVPAIIDNETYLCEAYAINEYLEKKYPQHPLLPKSPSECAKLREWVMTIDKQLILKIGLLLIETILKSKERQRQEVKDKLTHAIRDGLKDLNDLLSKKEYLFDTLSLADISITPHLAVLGRLGVSLKPDFPAVDQWLKRMQARPSFAASAG